MARSATQPRVRQFALYGVILLALALVSSVIFVLMSDDPIYSSEELFAPVVLVADKQPKFDFPEELRSTDLSVNEFIDRFFRLCAQANYPEVRLLLSQRSGESLPPNRFERMFNAMKEARIKNLREFPDPTNPGERAYILYAEYDLEAHAAKQQKEGNPVRLLIFKDQGQWRLGPVSRDLVAKVEAYDAAQAQPATAPSGDSEPVQNEDESPRRPGVVANRPMKVDPED